MKKKYIAIICSFYSIDKGYFYVQRSTFKKISESFDKVYVVNCQNLRFFPTFAKKVYMEKDYNETNFEKVNMPKNFVLFNPKNSNDFSNFLKDKEIIVMNHINKHFFDLKVQFLIKKHKLKQFQISNLGKEGGTSEITSKNHFFKSFIYFFNQKLFNKLTVILSNLGLVPKLEIRFFSNLKHLESIKKSKLKSFLYKKQLLWAKEIKLVNSMAYDIFLENKLKISEDYIVHLDAGLNNRHEIALRGEWPKEKVEQHYYYLEKFLKKLSKDFNKKVIVTIHPGYNIEDHQTFFKDFQIYKYRTTEFIFKSFMVTAFDSSAVTEAILLKKKLLGLDSDFMSKNERYHTSIYPKRVGYLLYNTRHNYNYNKNELLREMNNNISNYEKFISKYHCFDTSKSGSQVIVDEIKEKFF